jgi:hypothetical protein
MPTLSSAKFFPEFSPNICAIFVARAKCQKGKKGGKMSVKFKIRAK